MENREIALLNGIKRRGIYKNNVKMAPMMQRVAVMKGAN